MARVYSRDGKFVTEIISDFGGGMTNAVRSSDTRYARFIKNFDILSAEGKMSHLPGMEAETLANAKISKYLATNDKIYGLGAFGASDASAQIYEKTTVSAAWVATTTGGSASAGDRNENLFVEYQGGIYGAKAGTHIWKHTISPAAFDSTFKALTYDTIYQGIVHSKDDILYIPYTTVSNGVSTGGIAKYDGTTWTPTTAGGTPALTLPKNQLPVSICEFGNYLAIACQPKYRGGKSTVYLWDRDATLATLSEKYDWGYESLQWIEEVDGYLIGMSTTAFSVMNNLDTRIHFKYVFGGGVRKILEIPISSLTISVVDKQKINQRIYFLMAVKLLGTTHEGIWSFGRQSNGNFALSMDRHINNDTAITTPIYKGFFLYGDWMHVSYTANGTYVANRTLSSNPYASGTGTYESLILNAGDSDATKKLIGATVMFESLPASSTVVLDYSIDNNIGKDATDTTWTQIFSYNTQNGISHGAINIESSGVNLPQFKEIQFRIKVTGTSSSVTITGLKYKAEFIDKQLY